MRDLRAAALSGPLRLLPNRVPRYYRGGELLDRLLGVPRPQQDNWCEEWLGNATAPSFGASGESGLARAVLLDGSSVSVRELMEGASEHVLGADHLARFGTSPGFLLKYLDVGSRIPVHCHPTVGFAERHLSSPFGKTEAWLIVATRDVNGRPPRVWIGWRADVDRERLARWIETQDAAAMLGAMHEIEVHEDDVLSVPAGVPHSLGEGILAMEPQEPTDFAVVAETAGYGIDEPTATNGLGWETALDMFDYRPLGAEDVAERIRRRPRVERDECGGRDVDLLAGAASEFFRLNQLTVTSQLALETRGSYAVLAVRSGHGRLRGSFGEMYVRRGESFLVPAAIEDVELVCESRDELVVLAGRPPASTAVPST